MKEDVKTIKRDVELVKRRQQDVKGGVSALKAQSVKNGKRVRSLKTRMDRLSATHNVVRLPLHPFTRRLDADLLRFTVRSAATTCRLQACWNPSLSYARR